MAGLLDYLLKDINRYKAEGTSQDHYPFYGHQAFTLFNIADLLVIANGTGELLLLSNKKL